VTEGDSRSPALRYGVPALLLLLSLAYTALLHHGLGPRPVPDEALGWWSPRGFITQALIGSSWQSLVDDRGRGMLVFGAPSLLLLVLVWATTRSSLARALSVTITLALVFFLFYALGSGTSQLVWNFFHWRWSGTMVAVAAVVGFALASPWLAASWLRLGWPARIAWLVPLVGVVLAVERNVTGTNAFLPFAISPWPAVQVFGFEAIGTTLAAELGGVALALLGFSWLRSGRRALGFLVMLAGLALPAAWLAIGSGGLLPFRVTQGRLVGAAIVCVVMVAVGALGVRLDSARMYRRAIHSAAAAALLGIPLFVGAAWARWDYTRTRDVEAQRIIDALHRYYSQEQTYPDDLQQLVEAGLLDAVPGTHIGFPLPGRETAFTYQGFGTSYLLEFSAPRWVQCAYNPPYLDEEIEEVGGDGTPDVAHGDALASADGDAADGEDDLGGGAWSCPSKPPELW
jgi:hypothetical protein